MWEKKHIFYFLIRMSEDGVAVEAYLKEGMRIVYSFLFFVGINLRY